MAEMSVEEQIRQKSEQLIHLENFLKTGKIVVYPGLVFDIPSNISDAVKECCVKLRAEIKELSESL